MTLKNDAVTMHILKNGFELALGFLFTEGSFFQKQDVFNIRITPFILF